jgi:hypothetical protein
MNMFPGSTVPAVSRMLENTLAFLSSHPGNTFPSIKVTLKGDVPITNVEMLEADSMKILSATTALGGAINVATDDVQKVSNPPKKPAARKTRGKKVGQIKVANELPKVVLRLHGDVM